MFERGVVHGCDVGRAVLFASDAHQFSLAHKDACFGRAYQVRQGLVGNIAPGAQRGAEHAGESIGLQEVRERQRLFFFRGGTHAYTSSRSMHRQCMALLMASRRSFASPDRSPTCQKKRSPSCVIRRPALRISTSRRLVLTT